jgi:hypothetical protein
VTLTRFTGQVGLVSSGQSVWRWVRRRRFVRPAERIESGGPAAGDAPMWRHRGRCRGAQLRWAVSGSVVESLHRGIAVARPLRPLPEPITDPAALTRMDVRRQDRLGGLLHEYENAA